MAGNCTGIFRPCSYPLCSQSCIVPHAQELYECNDGTGAPGGYNRPCTCGQTSKLYDSTRVGTFFVNENGCVASNCSPSDQDLFWTTWVNLCFAEGYTVPRTLIPAEITLGLVTAQPPAASTTAVSGTTTIETTPSQTSSSDSSIGTLRTTPAPKSTAVPTTGHSTFSTAEIIGIVLGVVGVIPVLLGFAAWLFTYETDKGRGHRELRWRRGKKDLVFQAKNAKENGVDLQPIRVEA